jgi:TRAP-type C4-dicarboxylate transport system permease small subunit
VSRALERVYDAAGAVAALAILCICVVVSAQIGLNILARVGGPGWSWTIPSYADFAGFALASASFLALAHTLRRGAHIRVMLLTDRLPRRMHRALEVAALALGAAVAATATWYMMGLIGESWRYGDTSSGIVAVPLWIPQAPVALGLGLLTVALVHTLVEVWRGEELPQGEGEREGEGEGER